jgi:hypothetical protein
LLEILLELCTAGLCFWIVRSQVHKHADAAHSLGLLRGCHKGHYGRTANQTDEFSPPHVRPQGQLKVILAVQPRLVKGRPDVRFGS